jgi:tetratricopeptide (TPR) repeat protein
MCEYVNGNFSGAIDYLKLSHALDSTNINWQLWLGESYMMNGDYVQSLNHYKNWLEGNQSLSQGAVFGMHRIG